MTHLMDICLNSTDSSAKSARWCAREMRSLRKAMWCNDVINYGSGGCNSCFHHRVLRIRKQPASKMLNKSTGITTVAWNTSSRRIPTEFTYFPNVFSTIVLTTLDFASLCYRSNSDMTKLIPLQRGMKCPTFHFVKCAAHWRIFQIKSVELCERCILCSNFFCTCRFLKFDNVQFGLHVY
jgi:hypothetical protein